MILILWISLLQILSLSTFSVHPLIQIPLSHFYDQFGILTFHLSLPLIFPQDNKIPLLVQVFLITVVQHDLSLF